MEWIKWEGGVCPVDGDTRVDVLFEDGQTSNHHPAHEWVWADIGGSANIVGYRVCNYQPRLTPEEAYEDTVSALTIQHGGDHYAKLGDYQPWEVLHHWLTPEEFRGYMKGTAIAYLARERDKGGKLDIKKAAHTLQGLIELEDK